MCNTEAESESEIEQGLTSHRTHRSYQVHVFRGQKTQPIVKALKEDWILRIMLQSHQVHPTVLQ